MGENYQVKNTTIIWWNIVWSVEMANNQNMVEFKNQLLVKIIWWKTPPIFGGIY